jgi:hypothetical protein
MLESFDKHKIRYVDKEGKGGHGWARSPGIRMPG